MVSPLLQALIVVLLVVPAAQIVRFTGWRGRLALVAFVLACGLANPGRAKHVRAIERAVPEADKRMIDQNIEYHNFIVLSAASIQGRLVSLGLFERTFVGSISCGTVSRISVNLPASPPRFKCMP